MRNHETVGDNTKRLFSSNFVKNRVNIEANSNSMRTRTKPENSTRKFPELKKSRPISEARSRKNVGKVQLSLPTCRTRPKLISEPTHPDFRQLYYKREVTWQRPRDPTLFEGVRSFCKFTRLRRTNTDTKNAIPTLEEIKKERAIIRQNDSIRGYSRQGDIDDAQTPSFPVYSVWERMSPTVDIDESDTEQANGGKKSALSHLSEFSDLGLPRIFAEIHVWEPTANAKLLPSRRKNTLLYSRMYPWHPKPVTYHNFFLPQIEK
ncbi:hypothetical protein LSH36_32g00038 [Paralvinella palmiformis]|uniref:Uncharacterized protein n=1 Tax=Paralvinella palmiformis TaxID=53620 RepID=A0AAD9NH63_9ANNE|nr:hypothetical protein LSH36_32g00038 [Paralvinella palmiformis]